MSWKAKIAPAAVFLLVSLTGCEDGPNAPSQPGEDPFVLIERPVYQHGTQTYGSVISFSWTNGGDNFASFTRHMWSRVVDTNGFYNPAFDIIGDMNENPWRYEDKWSAWRPYRAAGDSGTSTILGDDETLMDLKHHVFAVQAMDKYGSVTKRFDPKTNIRRFVVNSKAEPFLLVYEPIIGGFKFIGTSSNPQSRKVPPGVPLTFLWRATASSYGGEIMGYRFGWDVPDLEGWDAPFDPLLERTQEVKLFSGAHTLTIEASDIGGMISRASIEIVTVPFPMERNLLWVDDFYSTNFPQEYYIMPTEREHDEFWQSICSMAGGFDAVRDVYDCTEYAFYPPPITHIGLYKNIVWTYSSAEDTWTDIVYFIPESSISTMKRNANYLSFFLMKGGHLWTLGRSDRGGGLAAVLDPLSQSFPMSLKCEILGNRDDCEGDRSGVYSMPYRDYCVSVLDKVVGIFRTGPDIPTRIVRHYDVMSHAFKDKADLYSTSCPELPERLDLWEIVTRPGNYFSPDTNGFPGGFTYAEVYDPEYWMQRNLLNSQHCFHPMYRMRAKNPASAIDSCTIALWVTKYEDIVPDVSSGMAVPAPSFHFGFPLWFFDREAADSIAAVVFDRWGILAGGR